MASESRFCDAWMANTIRNVTIVVPVLMTSCQVSENPNSGPVIAHTMTTEQAVTNAAGVPVARDVQRAKRVNSDASLPAELRVIRSTLHITRIASADSLTRLTAAKFRVFAYPGTLWSDGEFYRRRAGVSPHRRQPEGAAFKRSGRAWALWPQTSVRFSMHTVPNGCRASKSTATTWKSRTRTVSSATRPAAAPFTRCWRNGASRCASSAPTRSATSPPTRCRRSSSTSCWPRAIRRPEASFTAPSKSLPRPSRR